MLHDVDSRQSTVRTVRRRRRGGGRRHRARRAAPRGARSRPPPPPPKRRARAMRKSSANITRTTLRRNRRRKRLRGVAPIPILDTRRRRLRSGVSNTNGLFQFVWSFVTSLGGSFDKDDAKAAGIDPHLAYYKSLPCCLRGSGAAGRRRKRTLHCRRAPQLRASEVALPALMLATATRRRNKTVWCY